MFKVIFEDSDFDGRDFTDCVDGIESLDAAIRTAKDILENNLDEMLIHCDSSYCDYRAWDQGTIDNWNEMIDGFQVWIEGADGKVWEPSDADLESIGFVCYAEMVEA